MQPSIAQPAGIEGEVKLLPPLTIENIKAMAVKHGVATAEEVDAVVDELYAIARDPTTFCRHPAHRAGLGREDLTRPWSLGQR